MWTLIALTYPQPGRAAEVLGAIQRLRSYGALDVADCCRLGSGSIHAAHDGPASAAWAAVASALVAAPRTPRQDALLQALGIPPELAATVATAVDGGSAVLAMIPRADATRATAELAGFGGAAVTTPIHEEAWRRLGAAVDDDAATAADHVPRALALISLPGRP